VLVFVDAERGPNYPGGGFPLPAQETNRLEVFRSSCQVPPSLSSCDTEAKFVFYTGDLASVAGWTGICL